MFISVVQLDLEARSVCHYNKVSVNMQFHFGLAALRFSEAGGWTAEMDAL